MQAPPILDNNDAKMRIENPTTSFWKGEFDNLTGDQGLGLKSGQANSADITCVVNNYSVDGSCQIYNSQDRTNC
jgi:hypothetical protein